LPWCEHSRSAALALAECSRGDNRLPSRVVGVGRFDDVRNLFDLFSPTLFLPFPESSTFMSQKKCRT
jgi:hypothetical protein